jgi:hypothetical protein
MYSLGDHRKGQAGLVFVLLILVLILFLGISYIGVSGNAVDNADEVNFGELTVVDVDALVDLNDQLNLDDIEVKRIDNDFTNVRSRGGSSSSSSSSSSRGGSSSSGFSSGGGGGDNTAPIITDIVVSPSGGVVNNGSEQNVIVDFNSSEFPISIEFNLKNASGDVVNNASLGTISNSSGLPVNYQIPSGLDEGVYELVMYVSDIVGNRENSFISRILIDFNGFQCADGQTILKLEDFTNSHAELYNQSNYGLGICYDSLFGVPYSLGSEHACSGSNGVLSLFDDTNSHASEFNTTGYDEDICYGDLVCSIRTGSCLTDEVKVVGMFANNNSHVEVASQSNYGLSLCCSSDFAR